VKEYVAMKKAADLIMNFLWGTLQQARQYFMLLLADFETVE
jgi:hypothetical protein